MSAFGLPKPLRDVSGPPPVPVPQRAPPVMTKFEMAKAEMWPTPPPSYDIFVSEMSRHAEVYPQVQAMVRAAQEQAKQEVLLQWQKHQGVPVYGFVDATGLDRPAVIRECGTARLMTVEEREQEVEKARERAQKTIHDAMSAEF